MNWPLAVAATGVSATAAQVVIVAAVLWRTRGSNQRHDLTDTCRHCQAITTQTVTTIGSGRARRSAQRCLTCRHIAVDTAHRVVVLPR